MFTWTPDSNTPDTLYYQCFSHRYLGWKINVVDSCDHLASASIQEEHLVKIHPSAMNQTHMNRNAIRSRLRVRKHPKMQSRISTDIRNEINFESIRIRSSAVSSQTPPSPPLNNNHNTNNHRNHNHSTSFPILHEQFYLKPVQPVDRPLTTNTHSRLEVGNAHIIYASDPQRISTNSNIPRLPPILPILSPPLSSVSASSSTHPSEPVVSFLPGRQRSLRQHVHSTQALNPSIQKQKQKSLYHKQRMARPHVEPPTAVARPVQPQPPMDGGFTPLLPGMRSFPIWTEFQPLKTQSSVIASTTMKPATLKPPQPAKLIAKQHQTKPKSRSAAKQTMKSILIFTSTPSPVASIASLESEATSSVNNKQLLLPANERIVGYLNRSQGVSTFSTQPAISVSLRVPSGIPRSLTGSSGSSDVDKMEFTNNKKHQTNSANPSTTSTPTLLFARISSVTPSSNSPSSSSSSSKNQPTSSENSRASTALSSLNLDQLSFGDLSSSSYYHSIHVIAPQTTESPSSNVGKLRNHQLGLIDATRSQPVQLPKFTFGVMQLSQSGSLVSPLQNPQPVDEAILSHVLSLISSNEAPPEVKATPVRPNNRGQRLRKQSPSRLKSEELTNSAYVENAYEVDKRN